MWGLRCLWVKAFSPSVSRRMESQDCLAVARVQRTSAWTWGPSGSEYLQDLGLGVLSHSQPGGAGGNGPPSRRSQRRNAPSSTATPQGLARRRAGRGPEEQLRELAEVSHPPLRRLPGTLSRAARRCSFLSTTTSGSPSSRATRGGPCYQRQPQRPSGGAHVCVGTYIRVHG